ncbi:DUF4153 domain-containing protein [Aureimonas flava]|uniref:DUF4153 domain-containing protein n=1 Tax=Aureimonas flava TaxID=2320271 RepID=A0A3A1WWQ0_9HYPH|nr:DUF4153 domain-containing protein [Aureimonas flava]RIY03442.1 DUF4153 domain-containing protein [Aureimonas flava]
MLRAVLRPVRLLRSLSVRAGQATFRFPAAAAAIIAIGLIANWTVRRDFDVAEPLARVLLALTAGAAASVAMTLLAESRGAVAIAARLAGGLALAATAAAVGFAHPFLLHGPALTIAIVAAVPLAPFVGRGSSRAFWDFALWTALGVTLGWFSVLIFLLGFTAIFEMVRTLFGFGLGGDAYSHLFATGLTLVGPLFALGRIPHPGEVEARDWAGDRLERAVRPLFEWITAPLVLAVAVIIHAYAARIALTGNVPIGEIGWVVLLYGAFVLSLRVGLEPFLAHLPQPARFVAHRWAAMLVVPLALFAYALAVRVAAEGWTVERYFAAAYGVAAALAVLLQLAPRTRSDIRLVVAVPPVLLALSTFGPWGVADTVGRSQVAMIERRDGEALRGGAETIRGLDAPARQSLLSRLSVLETVERTDRLAPLLGAVGSGDAAQRVAALRGALNEGAALETQAAEAENQSFSVDGAFDVGGFDRVFPALDAAVGRTDGSVPMRLDGRWLVVTYRGRTDRFELPPTLGRPSGRAPSGGLPPLVIDLRSAEGRSLRLRLSRVRRDAQGVPVFVQGSLALRHGEWASPP